MSKNPYKLSQTLYGHSHDVRSITVTPNNDIISGSRDKTAKFWRYNPLQHTYEDVITYKDQTNFVASVLYLDPTEEFPDGLIITGGNDHVILVYKPSEPFATYQIKEHTNTVSCLGRTNEANTFLSGSWDCTAKLIKLNHTPAVVATFTGHTAAIWGVVQLGNMQIATASADKTIGIWGAGGQKIMSLTGHSDCVRSLADFPELCCFISCSNDASIKLWTYSGDNSDTYYGHTNYIYAVCRNKSLANSFVSTDEDRTVRYWENGQNIHTIVLPAQSVWTVACLSNGDIVTGSSDGLIRIFTREETRYADELTLTKYKEEVDALAQQSKQEIGGVKVSDLPGREALYDPGKREGQMKMVREEGKVVAYTWVVDGDNSHWEKVGDVMGGTDKDDKGKTVYEGKSYDFVFSVDVEDGKPPLKLPYNKGDDVYQAANQFLTNNMLPAEYLEQVVDFILKNSKEQYVPPNTGYQDPFTGENRYTPSFQQTTSQTGVNLDPFTGGSSYATSSAGTSSSYTYFPVSSYKTFDSGDPNVILNKLKEFNAKLPDKSSDLELECLVKLCTGPGDEADFERLMKLLDWPDDVIFPVLDVLRMAVKTKANSDVIVALNGPLVVKRLVNLMTSSVTNNSILALRSLCNLCVHPSGEDLVNTSRFEIVETLMSLANLNKNSQIALATLLLNLTVLTVKHNDEIGFSMLAELLPDVLTKLTDPESHFRVYVALGTLVVQSGAQKQEVVAKINDNQSFLSTLQLHIFGGNDLENKRSNCVKQLRSVL